MSDTAAGQVLPPHAITSATGILMERYDCTEDDATEVLIDWSLRTGVGLTDVVAWLIKDARSVPAGS
ncbi:ANTAR domain-containing protein [Actinomycetospora straminea]|uniref:ANTAR domain-containing protein n=1 Tax=Actinomycetospora straminea TaxID=663607 RepID=A0ABP9E965_9PSEU|nr:ANTAR domain-containing protein [Actinomycetospora straminea]MDD7931927.1 ANTAR domain-containing protein [Actinomycetospora straminea]